jgi:hypothetical protein
MSILRNEDEKNEAGEDVDDDRMGEEEAPFKVGLDEGGLPMPIEHVS